MAERPERDNRRGGRKSRKKVCAFCVDKIEAIDYKDISRLRRFVSERANTSPQSNRHMRSSSERAYCCYQARKISRTYPLYK